MGLGPQVTGILSDTFAAYSDFGAHSLRAAMLCVLVVNVMATGLYWLAGRDLRDDMRRRGELSAPRAADAEG